MKPNSKRVIKKMIIFIFHKGPVHRRKQISYTKEKQALNSGGSNNYEGGGGRGGGGGGLYERHIVRSSKSKVL